MSKHRWTAVELAELFYDALLRDHRSEDYTAAEMRRMAATAAKAVHEYGVAPPLRSRKIGSA